jgi:hypothetical protein
MEYIENEMHLLLVTDDFLIYIALMRTVATLLIKLINKTISVCREGAKGWIRRGGGGG